MIADAKYVHTNLVARDWRNLARFYQDVLGCTPMPPERNLYGPDYERGTGVSGAAAQGIHLLLPGHGFGGPTLEIFQYASSEASLLPAVNRPGLGHLAFLVPSVAQARELFLRAGGDSIGEIVRTSVSTDTVVTWCYMRDPEGNIVELQSRSQV